jgi:hypothetical protein
MIREMLLRDRYRGVINYGVTRKTYKRGTKVRVLRRDEDIVRADAPHLRIVSDDLWNAVQARFAKNVAFGFGERVGRKAKYLLSPFARCSLCHGPIHAKRSKIGSASTMVYLCGYYQDRGVCTNSLRRPLEEIDAACINWIRCNLLRENVIAEIIDGVRRRFEAGTADGEDLTPALSKDAERLRRECERLAEAIATTDVSVATLVQKLVDRQKQLAVIEARLVETKATPRAISLEIRHIEVEAKKRLAELQEVFSRQNEGARRALQNFLDGPLTFTPIETPEGRRYHCARARNDWRFTQRSVVSAMAASPGGVGTLLRIAWRPALSGNSAATQLWPEVKMRIAL